MSKKNKGDVTRLKRRWLHIGPGLVLALAISAFVGARYIRAEVALRQPSAPPIVERQVISSSYDERSGPTPEVNFIIDRSRMLSLTNTQLTGLMALESKWRKYYNPKIAQANDAAAQTNKYLAGAEGKSRTPAAQIQNAAAPVIALSREISSTRRDYWNQALSILTFSQRKTLQAEREAAWAAKMKRPSGRN